MWWIVWKQAGESTSLSVVRSASKPAGAGIIAAGGPYPTQAAAQQILAADQAKNPNPVEQAKNAVAAPLAGVAAIGQFFSQLGQRALWVRIAKVGIGVFMIIVGLNKLTGASSKIETGVGRVAKGALA